MTRSFNPQQAVTDDPMGVPAVGQYLIRIKADAIELRTGKSSGEPYLNIQGVILAGPLGAVGLTQKSPFAERIIFEMLSYSPNTQGRLGRAFIAVGHPQPPKDLDDIDEMTDEVFGGRVALWTVKHEEYNGEKRAKVQKWDPATAEMLAVYPHRPPNGGQPSSGGQPSAGAGPQVPVDDFSDLPF